MFNQHMWEEWMPDPQPVPGHRIQVFWDKIPRLTLSLGVFMAGKKEGVVLHLLQILLRESSEEGSETWCAPCLLTGWRCPLRWCRWLQYPPPHLWALGWVSIPQGERGMGSGPGRTSRVSTGREGEGLRKGQQEQQEGYSQSQGPGLLGKL